MSEGGLFSTYSICSDAAGVAGNLLAFVLFVSPIPTFRRIIRGRSTEEFSGLPYIYALLNCLICLWYGMPVVSSGIILIATVNSVGAIFQLIYIIIFIIYADRKRKLKMLGLLVAVFSVFAVIVIVSIRNMVIRTKSVEYMPFYLSLATFLMSLSFFIYGLFKEDAFISVPNGVGAILGIIQLVLYFCYSTSSVEVSRRPLLESNA
ncbi:bidirectional sugar transporter sweet2 [Phtheirospermum japonicum]|uniref:Bidirectional sugar transporter sweet2 n=1 Tax=Phtheirospermum japonicum TaxID=374723 RepID=A0A830C547_9LAMI|nr:bidirectional sugar transporter sweet2 [Phtheirospermum japonicum]